MLVSIFALIILYYLAKYIVVKIKEIKTGNKNENEANFWMFTYDFKTEKKDSIFDKDSNEIINIKRKKNNLIVLLYITHAAIFIYANYFLSKILIFILK
tara:strand:- start:1061 stop:1357 length:297 start_codon:yes stop_codon:yes gene_type:complete